MAIKIVFPTPESVPHSGGQRLLEIEADALDDLKGLSSRVDDGVRTFYAAPGSMARAKDGSAVYEYGPAGEWVPQGSGSSGPSEVVILPETELTKLDDGSFAHKGVLSAIPEGGKNYNVSVNGEQHEATATALEDAEGIAFALLGDDMPFEVYIIDPEFVEAYGGVTLLLEGSNYTPESITLSIVEKAETASAGGGGGVCLVNISAETADMQTFTNVTKDKAFAEMDAAYNAGGLVWGRLSVNSGGMIIKCEAPLGMCMEEEGVKGMMFFPFGFFGDAGVVIRVNEDDSCSVYIE